MRVLLFCDDFYHPGEIPANGMKPLEAKGVKLDVVSDAMDVDFLLNGKLLPASRASECRDNVLAVLTAAQAAYDVIVMSKCDHISQKNNAPWKTGAVQAAIVKFVEDGGGLLVTHSGTVSGEENDTSVLDKLIGCKFVFHPNNCPVTVGVLKPHPVTKGVGIFCETDEHYHIEILADDIDILAASFADAQGEERKYESEPYFNAPACIAPCAYVRTQGKGRICVLTLGHVAEVWLNAEFQRMLENALRWCAGETL